MNEPLQFLTQHGTIVLFVIVLAEQIGFPVPAFLFLIAAGALAGTGHMSLGMAIGAAVLAAVMGDQLWYELGRRRGRGVLNWLCRISFEPSACVSRTHEFFTRHGVRALIVAKFIPGLSTIAPPTCWNCRPPTASIFSIQRLGDGPLGFFRHRDRLCVQRPT
jgi:membrane protein DedA with SNARE-associated domain